MRFENGYAERRLVIAYAAHTDDPIVHGMHVAVVA